MTYRHVIKNTSYTDKEYNTKHVAKMAASSPLGTKTIAGHLYLSPQSILVPEEFLAAVLTTCFVKLLSSATCDFDHVAGYHVVFLFWKYSGTSACFLLG